MDDPIKQRLASLTATVEWNGQTVHLRALGAEDGIEVLKAIQGIETGPDEEAKDMEAGRRFYVLLISKCYVDAEGTKLYDSDEGRATLLQLPLADVLSLGRLANLHCGFGDEAKKN